MKTCQKSKKPKVWTLNSLKIALVKSTKDLSLTSDQRASLVCDLIGHSRIISMCFGYVYCGRCEAQIGDTLGGADSVKENVVIDHNCETCKANYEKMTWQDKFMTPKQNFEKGKV